MLRTVSRITAILLVTLFLFSCKTSKIFNKGHIQLPTQQHTIPINFVNNWPLVNVRINGKDYVFLLDTGAPTVISKRIYDDLNIKPYVQQKVIDSQGEGVKQDFVVIPEMWVDLLKFSEIGAVVMDLHATEFCCHRIDGILGANQMAKLAWKINYNEGTAVVAQDFAELSFDAYDHKIPFRTEHQNIPLIKMSFRGINRVVTFDTGATGYMSINDAHGKLADNLLENQKFSLYGIGSIGAFGVGKMDTVWNYLLDEIDLGGEPIQRVFANTAQKKLLGNDFLQQYEFALDWKSNHIYLKRVSQSKEKVDGYGYGYRFIDNVPTVTLIVHGPKQAIEIGDVILSMNGISMENLDDDKVCTYLVNKIENQSDTVHLKIKRNEGIKEFTLTKKVFLE